VSYRKHRLGYNLPVTLNAVGVSGTSSAKTTAKPLNGEPHQYKNHKNKWRYDGLGQVPIDVAVEQPRTRVVGEEADSNIVTGIADAHDVADYGIDEVVGRIPCATDHPEGVPVQMHRVLYRIALSE
jgi:hypothetical protein